MPTVSTPRVVVKFRDNLINVTIPDAVGRFLNQLKDSQIDGTNWAELIARFKHVVIEPLQTALSQERLLDLINIAKKRDPNYDIEPSRLLTYFSIPCPPGVQPEELISLLSAWKAVETVYIEESPADEPAVTPGQNPALSQTDTKYLDAAPAGIDAYYAWNKPGGDGGKDVGIALQLLDIESNWDVNHPELKPASPHWTGYGDRTVLDPQHGTRVLGIIIAADSNPTGHISSMGITPDIATTLLASYWKNRTKVDHYSAIHFAIDKLNYGDVLLLETQINSGTLANLPVEYSQHNFDAISLATASGITVIEAAGNNKYDLGTLGKPWLQRPSNKDSGAIMVAAASSWKNGGTGSTTPPDYIHLPILTGAGERCHNFGNRIDCYAWGENIYTTAVNNDGTYGYGNFGGTSGASAIIAGAALAVQGMAEYKFRRRFSPRELRAILSDPATGTLAGVQGDPPDKYKIGVMPDLKAICLKHRL